jgi:predicted DNA-binding transcriptional regulator AlpA
MPLSAWLDALGRAVGNAIPAAASPQQASIAVPEPSCPVGDSLLKLADVRSRTAMSTTTIYAQMAAGKFPLPLKRGRQSVWIASEVQAEIDRQIATLPRMEKAIGARASSRLRR